MQDVEQRGQDMASSMKVTVYYKTDVYRGPYIGILPHEYEIELSGAWRTVITNGYAELWFHQEDKQYPKWISEDDLIVKQVYTNEP